MNVFATCCGLAILLLMARPSDAQNYNLIYGNDSESSVRAYWTPERIAGAKPRTMPITTSSPVVTQEERTPPPGESQFETVGRPPSIRPESEGQPGALIQPDSPQILEPKPDGNGLKPLAVGSSGLYFTSTRLVPVTADTEYPYRAAGKLLFTVPGQPGNSSCTASVIQRRLLLTAGHCVTDGKGTTFQNFMFTPSFRNGAAPFGTWTWANIGLVPNTWLNGGGTVPNAADYAILIMQDGVPGAGGAPPRLGDVVGYLGVATLSVSKNDLFILGYPGNLDGGNMMHQVNSGQSTSAGSNTVKYGGDMGPGASGGPWIQNFGVAAVGQVGGATNQVVAVTSYVSTNAGPLYEGASIPDNRFQDIYVAACAQAPGNCQ